MMRGCLGFFQPAGHTAVIVQHSLIRIVEQIFAVVEVDIAQRVANADHVQNLRIALWPIREHLPQIAQLHRASGECVQQRVKLRRVQTQVFVQPEFKLHLDVFALGANHDFGISPKRNDVSMGLLLTILDVQIRPVRAVDREVIERFGDNPVGIAVQTLNHGARQSLRLGVVQVRRITTHAERATQELRHDVVSVEAVPLNVHKLLKHLPRARPRRALVSVRDQHL